MRWQEKKFSFYFSAEKRLEVYRWLVNNGIKPIDPNKKGSDRFPKYPHPVLEPYYIIQIPVVKISGGLDHTETTDDYWVTEREVLDILEHYNDATRKIPTIKKGIA